jgi:hypothetical protein
MKKIIIDGFNVDVGQNARENDVLTLGAASKDIWFHVENYPGSHVILRNPTDGMELSKWDPLNPIDDRNQLPLSNCVTSWKEYRAGNSTPVVDDVINDNLLNIE